MEKVNFDPEYIPLIVEEKKKTTIRRGIKSYPVGKLVEFTVENSRTFAIAKIRKVVVKRINELTEDDAKLDGFESRDELIRALKRIYGDIKDNEFVTIVHFDVVKNVNRI